MIRYGTEVVLSSRVLLLIFKANSKYFFSSGLFQIAACGARRVSGGGWGVVSALGLTTTGLN